MSDFLENLWGWEALNPDLISDDVWNQVYGTYVGDSELSDWLKDNNPYAYQSMTARMLDTALKGNWDASDEVLKSLATEYAESVVNDGVTCCHHTCGNPLLNEYVNGLVSVPGFSDAIAVGFPQPNPRLASSGITSNSWSLYPIAREVSTAWLLPQGVRAGRDDMPDCSRLPMGFTDMLASCDAVLTKPGYGTYTEAVCNGVPILTLARPDWPETAGMNDWARQHGRLQEISQAQFASGGFAAALQVLWQQPAVPPPAPTGIGEAAALLAARLPPG